MMQEHTQETEVLTPPSKKDKEAYQELWDKIIDRLEALYPDHHMKSH